MSIKKHGIQNFKRQILYQFDKMEQAYKMQKELVNQQFVKRNDTYNIKIGGEGGMDGRIAVKDKDGNTQSMLISDPRYLSKQFVHVTSGMINVRCKDNNIINVSVDDPRYLSGQLKCWSKNKLTTKDDDGVFHHVFTDDPRYLSGQFVSIMVDIVAVKDKDGKFQRISVNDPRYLSGQLVGVNKGFKFPEGHQVGQKNSQYGTMWITNGIQSIKIKKDQQIPEGWYKGRVCKK